MPDNINKLFKYQINQAVRANWQGTAALSNVDGSTSQLTVNSGISVHGIIIGRQMHEKSNGAVFLVYEIAVKQLNGLPVYDGTKPLLIHEQWIDSVIKPGLEVDRDK